MSEWLPTAAGLGAAHAYIADPDPDVPLTQDLIGSANLTVVGATPERGHRGCSVSAEFNGAGSFVVQSGMPADQPFSLECQLWVGGGSGGFYTAAIVRSSTDFEVGGISVGAGADQTDPPRVSVAGELVYRRGQESILHDAGPIRVDDGRCHHVIVTASSSGRRMFLDGDLITERPDPLVATGSPTGLRIGANGYIPGTALQGWVGSISSVAVYPRALSESEAALLASESCCRRGGFHIGLRFGS